MTSRQLHTNFTPTSHELHPTSHTRQNFGRRGRPGRTRGALPVLVLSIQTRISAAYSLQKTQLHTFSYHSFESRPPGVCDATDATENFPRFLHGFRRKLQRTSRPLHGNFTATSRALHRHFTRTSQTSHRFNITKSATKLRHNLARLGGIFGQFWLFFLAYLRFSPGIGCRCAGPLVRGHRGRLPTA